jgi:hypothetical protein
MRRPSEFSRLRSKHNLRSPLWATSGIAFLSVVLFAICFATTLHAQTRQLNNLGTDFYVAYGPNLGQGDEDNVMDLYITSKAVAHGTVEVPALGFFQTFTTTPGQITTINLPNGRMGGQTVELTEDEEVIRGMAVHVTSDSEVAVFGLNHKHYSSDAFMGFPSSVLGTEYRTMCYQAGMYGGNGGIDPTPSDFWVVAVQDSTNVTITLRDNSEYGVPPNSPFTVRLDKGDTYLVEGSLETGNDLTGSLIESDYPVAVFSGHKRTNIPATGVNSDGTPSRDHLVEELPPVSAWGDSALVVPFATSKRPDLVRVVCAEDGTDISVNGQSVGTFNAGDFYEISQLSGVTSIQASKPILVGQYMHTSRGVLDSQSDPPYGDPALALVFPVEQFTTSYTILSIVDPSSYKGNFVNIVADASSIGSIRLDGNPINAAEFKPIPNTRFAYAQHQLQQGTHNLTCDQPFGVTIYALGPVDSYAYTGGTLLKTITPLKTVGLVIDFGDRLLSPDGIGGFTDNLGKNKFDTTVYLQNVSEDVVNVYGFPTRIQDVDRFSVTKPIASLSSPHTIKPLALDSMTIEFYPHEVNRRMHTQVTAETDHLRAYVVDVYGRGVQDVIGIFRDSQKIYKIDTLDFGIFTSSDVAKDSEVYIGNAGRASLLIQSVVLSTSANSPFAETSVSYNGNGVVPPFAIPEPPSAAALVNVSFNPTALGNGRYEDTLQIAAEDGTVHTVVLVGRVETITALAPQISSVTFGHTYACSDSSFLIPISNPNDIAISLSHATIFGINAGDFAVSTKTPLLIPPGQTVMIVVHFLPTDRGMRTAQLAISFDLPKNAPVQYVTLAGLGDKYSMMFEGSQNVTAYSTDQFIVPIYARTDLTPYSPNDFFMHVHYDTTYLKLLDVITANTLIPQAGSFSIFNSTPPGSDTIEWAQGGASESQSGAPITGGGPGSTTPFIYLKFQTLLPGVDPQTFTDSFSIAYDVELGSTKIPATCVDDTFLPGAVQIIPVCSDPHLVPQSLTVPQVMYLGLSAPNPFGTNSSGANPSTTMEYDVSTQIPIRIEAFDAAGNLVRTIVDDTKVPGYYEATLDGSGLPAGDYLIRMTAGDYQRVRRVVLKK